MSIRLRHRSGGRLALRAKMAVVAGVPLLILALAVPVLLAESRTAERAADEIEDVYRARAGIARLTQDLIDAETNARGYMLTNDPRFLQPYRVGAASAPGDLVRLGTALEDDARNRAAVERLDELLQERLALLRRQIRFAGASDPGMVPDELIAQGRVLTERVRAELQGLDSQQVELLAERREELARIRTTSTIVSVVLVPLAVLASILLVVAFANRLVRRISRIEHEARRLEDGGLLEPEGGHDEIARLATTLAQASERLSAQDAALRDLALVDPLTGLRNRRGFLELAEHELEVCGRTGTRTALLYLDLDGLKQINDERGHAAGDRLIREAAAILVEATRSSDLVARIGGDEFCVLLAREATPDPEAVLTRIGSACLASSEVVGPRVSFSIGVAEFDPGAPVGLGELIELADRRMYDAKRVRARSDVSS